MSVDDKEMKQGKKTTTIESIYPLFAILQPLSLLLISTKTSSARVKWGMKSAEKKQKKVRKVSIVCSWVELIDLMSPLISLGEVNVNFHFESEPR